MVVEAAWLHNILVELSRLLTRTIIVFCGNVSDMYLASDHVQHQRAKHVEKDYYVREPDSIVQVHVLHVPSTHHFACIFTEGLLTQLFTDFRNSLSIQQSLAQLEGEC